MPIEDARELKAATLNSITNAALKHLLGNHALESAALAIGSTVANVATGAFQYCVDGIIYSKGAVAAGTAFTDVTVQPDGTTRLYLVAIDVEGTIVIVNGEEIPLGGKPDDIRVPPCPAGHAPVGVVKVVTDGAVFTPGTTGLDAATVTDTYYNLALGVQSVPA